MTGHQRTWAIPRQREAVPETRAKVRKALADWGHNDTDDIEVVVSELVTNAIRHGAPGITLVLALDGNRVHGRVIDHGTRMPEPRDAGDDEGGRGLAIVAACTSRWGVEPLPDGAGKTVWFECRGGPS